MQKSFNENQTAIGESLAVQWFPGHMKKTERLIKANLPMVDAVIEIADARIPQSSRNPLLSEIIKNKKRVILLNKSDIADPVITKEWIKLYNKNDINCLASDCKNSNINKEFTPFVKEALSDLLAERQKKGTNGKPIRLMVTGIPNVGKSSFINRVAGLNKTKVEDRPGVTRGKQWIRINSDFDLLDMPGILWHKFDDKTAGEHLAFTGAVKDDVVDIEMLAARLLAYLSFEYPKLLEKRYKIINPCDMEESGRLKEIGKKRGMFIHGGEIDTQRAAAAVLDDFRGGKIGRISLEKPIE